MKIKFDGVDEGSKSVAFSEMEIGKFYRLVVLNGGLCDNKLLYVKFNAYILLEFNPLLNMPECAAHISVSHTAHYVLETRPVTITIKS